MFVTYSLFVCSPHFLRDLEGVSAGQARTIIVLQPDTAKVGRRSTCRFPTCVASAAYICQAVSSSKEQTRPCIEVKIVLRSRVCRSHSKTRRPLSWRCERRVATGTPACRCRRHASLRS